MIANSHYLSQITHPPALITNHTSFNTYLSPIITQHQSHTTYDWPFNNNYSLMVANSHNLSLITHPAALITNQPPLNCYIWLNIYCNQSHTTYYWPLNNKDPSFVASGHDQSHTITTRQHKTLITHHSTLNSRRLPLITDHAPLITDHSSITTHYWLLTSTRPY